MADEVKYEGTQFRLRAGTPMPTDDSGRFYLHTFMAEKSKIEFYACTNNLPVSADFRGNSIGGVLVSASFTRLGIVGGEHFSGRKVYKPEYVEEDDIDHG